MTYVPGGLYKARGAQKRARLYTGGLRHFCPKGANILEKKIILGISICFKI